MDFLHEAYRQVRRNGGAAGVDGETFADIEHTVWSGGSGNWRENSKKRPMRPRAVRQVLIPKKQKGKFRHWGYLVCVIGWFRPRRCFCCRRYLKPRPAAGAVCLSGGSKCE